MRNQIRLRTSIVAACLLTPFLVGVSAQAQTTPKGEAMALRWALAAFEEERSTPVAVQKDTKLKSGTRLKFLIEPLSEGYVYLLHLDPANAMTLLHRDAIVGAAVAKEKAAYVPADAKWFVLDDSSGLETFFLLASRSPLSELDTLIDKQKGMTGAARVTLDKQILDEVRRVQKAHRNFARPVEKPVMIGGRTRGGDDIKTALDRLAVDVSAEQFYEKTITIEH